MDEENSKYERWKQSTQILFGTVDIQMCQPYSIPVVPDELRKWNEDAYMPKVVSIGPRYKGRRDLLPMEEVKLSCMRFLLDRTKEYWSEVVLDKCMDDLLKFDGAVRASYVDEIKLDRYDLATIMLYDGCFLLELLISSSAELNSKLRRSSSEFVGRSSPGEEVRKMELVMRDLTLLQNQIPFFILSILLDSLFDINKIYDYCGTHLGLFGIYRLPPSLFGLVPNWRDVDARIRGSHLLEIASSYIHSEVVATRKIEQENKESQQQAPVIVVDRSGEEALCVKHLNRCATRLHAAGITIKYVNNNNNNNPKVVTFKFNIEFNNSNNKGILAIPLLNITQTTESQWRNFIAWEHHKKNSKISSSTADDRCCCLFTSSALLFSDLICCASDVQLLKDRGVIVDHLKMRNRDLVAFFHSITNGVDRGILDPVYSNIFHALNTYSTSRSYATKIPILFCHYFGGFLDWMYSLHKFLRRGYNFAATLITVLTVVQTCYAIVAYHFPKN